VLVAHVSYIICIFHSGELITRQKRESHAKRIVDSANGVRKLHFFLNSCIVINGISPDAANIGAGVPHGSILGLLLFSFFINDIVLDIRSNIILFA
jgi:hypothetical protein